MTLKKRIINFLRRQQVGETVRELGLEGQTQKAGTPTMGGLIIIIATLIPVLLLTKIDNIYIILLIVTTLWMGSIGFIDDYIKIFKKDKEGLKGIFKVFGQVGLGLIVGTVLYFNPVVTTDAPRVEEFNFAYPDRVFQFPEVVNTTFCKSAASLSALAIGENESFNPPILLKNSALLHAD